MATSNTSNDLKALTVLHAAMVFGIIAFTAISIFLNRTQGPLQDDAELNKILPVVVSILAAGGLFASHLFYKKRINQAIEERQGLQHKLESYRAALILYLALSEGAALFGVVAFLLTGNYLMMIVVGVLLINMMIKRPGKEKFVDEMQLSSQERIEAGR